MTGVMCAIAAAPGAPAGSESFIVTTDSSGVFPDRFRGFNGYDPIGSCVPAASAKYSGALVDAIQYSEGGGSAFYMLSISGAANDSRWSTMTIDGTTTLNRTSATYSAGGVWTWATADTVGTNKFGLPGSVHTVVIA